MDNKASSADQIIGVLFPMKISRLESERSSKTKNNEHHFKTTSQRSKIRIFSDVKNNKQDNESQKPSIDMSRVTLALRKIKSVEKTQASG